MNFLDQLTTEEREAYNQHLNEIAHAVDPRAGHYVIVMRRGTQIGQCGINYLDPQLDFVGRDAAQQHLDQAFADGRAHRTDGWSVVPEFEIHDFANHYMGRTN